MAEEKKPIKTGGGSGDKKMLEQVIFLLIGLFLLAAILVGLLNYIENLGLGSVNSIWARVLNYFLNHVWPVWRLIAGIVSLLALIGIVYNFWKLRAINIEEQKIYNPLPETVVGSDESITRQKKEKWEKVLKYLNSNSASDWRLAIIEADVMLEDMLRSKGFAGDSVGDMLKSADKSDFLTLDDAWEAHKIRNAIAHSGGDFQLSEREARRATSLFERVFKEFQII